MTMVLGFVLAVGMVLYIGYPLFVRGGVDEDVADEAAVDEIERAVAARRGRGKATGRPKASAPAGAAVARFCPACGAARGSEDRFCASCGAALDNRCPSCGAAHEDSDRYCAGCGEALTAL